MGCRFFKLRIGLGMSDGFKMDCIFVLLDMEEVFREMVDFGVFIFKVLVSKVGNEI